MEIFNLDPIVAFILLGMITGVVEFIKALWESLTADWHQIRVCAIIGAAGGTGALTALALGINPLIGAVVGFAASGYVTIAQNISKN